MTTPELDLDAIEWMANRASVDESGRQEAASPSEVLALVAEVRRLRAQTWEDLKQLSTQAGYDLGRSDALASVRELHSPMPGDEHAAQRCRGCIAGYYPATGDLVHCAYPCPTIQALDGPTP